MKLWSVVVNGPMNTTWLVWLGLVLVTFLCLEEFGYFRYGLAGTLSVHIRDWTAVHPLIPFVLGVLVGVLAFHFFAASYYKQ